MAVLVPFVEFSKKFEKIKHAVVVLSLTSSVMWMCYPGTALGGQPPFSYVIFQTFMYHGLLFNWAALSVSLGKTEMNIKKCWQTFVGILVIFVWAKFGNSVYGKSNNWFFIEESIFPFLSDKMMPLAVIFGVFAVCLMMYGMNYLIKFVYSKVKGHK